MGFAKFAESYELLIMGRFLIGVNCGEYLSADVFNESPLSIKSKILQTYYPVSSIMMNKQFKFGNMSVAMSKQI